MTIHRLHRENLSLFTIDIVIYCKNGFGFGCKQFRLTCYILFTLQVLFTDLDNSQRIHSELINTSDQNSSVFNFTIGQLLNSALLN